MDSQQEEDLRVSALCRKLGTLWSNKTIVSVDHLVSAQKKQQGLRTLIGHIFQNPKVNVQAFKSTMRKVWKQENVEIELLAPGIYEFQFASVKDRDRILDASPWSFANHLVLLQPWKPNTPPAYYRFDYCVFWVHIHGMPSEWISEEVMWGIAEEIGTVHEVKIDSRGYLPYKIGKARVSFKSDIPLQLGSLFKNEGRTVWLDYKYERLPYFCYSCGRIGHYARYCSEIPYAEVSFDRKCDMKFGPWLKTEDDNYSPFWDFFYGATVDELMEEEYIPETPSCRHAMVIYEQGTKKQQEEQGLKDMEKRKGILTEELPGSSLEAEGVEPDSLHKLPLLANCRSRLKGPEETSCTKSPKMSSKKAKRFTPYGKPGSKDPLLDESTLMETPVLSEDEVWALVAGPQQPPRYP